MKRKLSLIITVFCIVGICVASSAGIYEAVQSEETANAESEFEPEPLVIETSRDAPQGIYHVTIVINGERIEDSGYEGIAFVEMDGRYMRISCTDAVRSQFGDYF